MKRSWDVAPPVDVVVVGSGVAGLAAALDLGPRRVRVLTKTSDLPGGSSPLAQGGVAAAVGEGDSPTLHARDTMIAAAGLADERVVDALTAEAPGAISRLVRLGTHFDRAPDGALALSLEGAHSARRVVHAGGDATGAELVRALGEAVRRSSAVELVFGVFVEDLWVENGRVTGVLARHDDGRLVAHPAGAVVLASGGIGHVYAQTTNATEATGDGLAMAARAGALLGDLEFVQFHPTALAVGKDPMPLLTEALRGEGALLVDGKGRRFMPDVDPRAELAPRDIVARAIWTRAREGETVYLDARHVLPGTLAVRYPSVTRICAESGLDPAKDLLPVLPAAHYHMGGVAVDLSGRSSVPGLWACGEAARTGVHGANRLASNSLLEALVFGARVARDVATSLDTAPAAPALAWASPSAGSIHGGDIRPAAGTSPVRERVRRLMSERVGLVRDALGLRAALAELAALEGDGAAGEARNLLLVARLVAASALLREESRGAHFRSDFPETDSLQARSVLRTAAEIEALAGLRLSRPLFGVAARQ